MTAAESWDVKIGTRVFWRGDAADSGIITKTMGRGHDCLEQSPRPAVEGELSFTIFAILFARRSAPERGHLTFRFSADDLPRLLTISYSTC